jgi:hypothetical protein
VNTSEGGINTQKKNSIAFPAMSAVLGLDNYWMKKLETKISCLCPFKAIVK